MDTKFDFFELKTPNDLFRKIEKDFEDLKASNHDSRIAFNLFVTIEHFPDWIAKRGLVKDNCILRVVSHIANGAKHFYLDENRHKSVASAEKSGYVKSGYVKDDYIEEPLVIKLTESEKSEIGMDEIDVIELGRWAIEFWHAYLPVA